MQHVSNKVHYTAISRRCLLLLLCFCRPFAVFLPCFYRNYTERTNIRKRKDRRGTGAGNAMEPGTQQTKKKRKKEVIYERGG